MRLSVRNWNLNKNKNFIVFCCRATLFTIKLGTTQLSDVGDNVISLATENYVVHPEFNPNTLDNDLGAIKFRSYIQMTGKITKTM